MPVLLRLIKQFPPVFPGTPRQKLNYLSSTWKAKNPQSFYFNRNLVPILPQLQWEALWHTIRPCVKHTGAGRPEPDPEHTTEPPKGTWFPLSLGATESWCHGMPLRKNNTISTVYLISNEGKTLLMQLDQGSAWGVFTRVWVAFSGWGLIIISRLQFPTNKG